MAINNTSIFMPIGKRRLIERNKGLINNNLRLAEITAEGRSRFYFTPEISGFPGCFPIIHCLNVFIRIVCENEESRKRKAESS